MAGGVIHAAWIQAIPVAIAAGAAIYGLATWGRQVRGQRHIEHAEKAMASAKPAFNLTRATRSPLMGIPQEEVGSHSKRAAAIRRIISDRLERAWTAWERFDEHYHLAGLFAERSQEGLDVSKELADCLYDLRDSAELMFSYDDDYDPSDALSREHRKEFIRYREAFYGSRSRTEPDTIEARLRAAEAALKVEMMPVLRPAPLSTRAKARCARWWNSVTRNANPSDPPPGRSPSP